MAVALLLLSRPYFLPSPPHCLAVVTLPLPSTLKCSISTFETFVLLNDTSIVTGALASVGSCSAPSLYFIRMPIPETRPHTYILIPHIYLMAIKDRIGFRPSIDACVFSFIILGPKLASLPPVPTSGNHMRRVGLGLVGLTVGDFEKSCGAGRVVSIDISEQVGWKGKNIR